MSGGKPLSSRRSQGANANSSNLRLREVHTFQARDLDKLERNILFRYQLVDIARPIKRIAVPHAKAACSLHRSSGSVHIGVCHVLPDPWPCRGSDSMILITASRSLSLSALSLRAAILSF